MSRVGWCALALAILLSGLALRGALGPAPTSASLDAPPLAASSTLPPLRLRWTELGSGPIVIRVEGPYRVTQPGDWRVLAQGSRLERAEVAARGDALQIGPRSFPGQAVEVQAVERGTLWVGDIRCDGDLRLLDRGDRQVVAVQVVLVEGYVAAVVAAEQAADPATPLPPAAAEALAIAARSLALYRMKTAGAAADWDLESEELPWCWPDEEAAGQAARAAAAATEGVIACYRGRLVCLPSTASCGGHTLDGREIFPGAAPPLVGVPCPACRDAAAPLWQRGVARATLQASVDAHLARQGRSLGRIERVEVTAASAERLPTVTLVGEQATWTTNTHVLRSQILAAEPLPGNCFRLEPQGDDFLAVGRGIGHGVGLCRRGSRQLAARGCKAAKILEHYFPRTELRTVR